MTPDRWHVWIQNVSSVSAWVVGTHIPATDPLLLTQGQAPQEVSPNDESGARRIATLLDDTAGKMIAIAKNEELSVEEKLPVIYKLNNEVLGWDSPKWAELLDVTDAAVRKTDWWKFKRPELRRDG